jgi:rod shape determining protein RodA
MATITAPLDRRKPRAATNPLAHVDVVLLSLPFIISALGLVMIYDASRGETSRLGLVRTYFVQRQGIALVLGLAAMFVVMAIDYRRIRDLWALVYALMVPLLAGVLVLGDASRGAQAWFQVGPMQFQPSEVSKVGLIIAIAGYCHQHRGELDAWRLAVVLGMAGVVMGIVYLQHDLGTMLVMMVCVASMLVVAGIKPVHIGVLILLAITLVGAAVVTGRLETYQLERLTAFADQSNESAASVSKEDNPAKFNLDRSKRAIASGGFTGAGLGNGELTRTGNVPEQHTDFIFTAVAEDLGFLGAATLLLLYAILAWRLWRIAVLASDFFGTLVTVGVLAMFTVQVFENVGMTMGLMPITGIPLPFMSYGGSSVIASFIAIGLVLNIHMRRFS